MTSSLPAQQGPWTFMQKMLFRFFFIYFILYTSPWNSLSVIPGISYLLDLYNSGLEWLVIKTNEYLFHVFGIKYVKPVFNGSGDTSYSWAENYFLLLVAAAGALIWWLADRKAKSYRQLNYLLCLFIRYSLALIAFGYGIIKIFALQMPFPSMSQLATPLGDLLPMRLSWMFIGYSTPYQVFSGVMELLVAFLLLYRRTATLGTLIAAAVFINVMVLNLSYDIPVKLFSINLVLACLYLLVNEYDRIVCFFILNKPAANCSIYDYPLTKKWMRITRIIIKICVLLLFLKTGFETIDRYNQYHSVKDHKDFKPGFYTVTKYSINNDSISTAVPDSTRWKDLIIDDGSGGSINTSDTAFRQRYGRGYFYFETDSVNPVIRFSKAGQDILFLQYKLLDSNSIRLWGKYKNDSLLVEIQRSARRFQLAERQFHWLSEANR